MFFKASERPLSFLLSLFNDSTAYFKSLAHGH
jgi:hypothetical protein